MKGAGSVHTKQVDQLHDSNYITIMIYAEGILPTLNNDDLLCSADDGVCGMSVML